MKYSYAILQNRCKDLIDPYNQLKDKIFETYEDNKFQIFLNYFKKCFFRLLRKTKIIKDLPVSIQCNCKWKRKIKKINNWIIFYDSNQAKLICEYIKRYNPTAHVYAYSWDIKFIPQKDSCFNGIGTFDLMQAKTYNIAFYSQFYSYSKKFHHFIKPIQSNFSFVFLGRKKNRYNTIIKTKQLCDSVDKNSYWKIINDTEPGIRYIDYLGIIYNCKCIIDIVIDGQSGLSLRVMEALFFNKKLITNNKHISKMDFYNPNNIFILDIDKELNSFMEKQYQTVPDSIKNNYLLDSFVKRITQ